MRNFQLTHPQRIAINHAMRLDYLYGNPIQFLTLDALDLIAARAQRDGELRQDVAEYARRGDALSALWFARELENIDRRLHTQPRIPLVGLQIVPIDRTIPEWARTHRWQETSEYGEPVVVSEQTSASIPIVSMTRQEVTTTIDTYAIAWAWSQSDIETAARMGLPLSERLPMLARRVMDRRIDQTLLIGDTNTGALGILKQPGVPIVAATTKTGGGVAWSAAALGTEIIADLMALANAVNLAQGVSRGKVVIVLDLQHDLILDRPMTGTGMTVTDNGSTIRSYIAKNYGDRIATILGSPRNTTAGAGGVHRIMAMPAFASEEEATEVVFGLLNKQFTPYPGTWQDGGLLFKQIAVAKCGGCAVRNPEFLAYMDGT